MTVRSSIKSIESLSSLSQLSFDASQSYLEVSRIDLSQQVACLYLVADLYRERDERPGDAICDTDDFEEVAGQSGDREIA